MAWTLALGPGVLRRGLDSGPRAWTLALGPGVLRSGLDSGLDSGPRAWTLALGAWTLALGPGVLRSGLDSGPRAWTLALGPGVTYVDQESHTSARFHSPPCTPCPSVNRPSLSPGRPSRGHLDVEASH